jgi:hypothetical protein
VYPWATGRTAEYVVESRRSAFFGVIRRSRNQTRAVIAAKPPTPPATAPAITPTLSFDFCGPVGNVPARVEEPTEVALEVRPEDSLVVDVALTDRAGSVETTCPLTIQTPSPFLQQDSAATESGSPQQRLPFVHAVI